MKSGEKNKYFLDIDEGAEQAKEEKKGVYFVPEKTKKKRKKRKPKKLE